MLGVTATIVVALVSLLLLYSRWRHQYWSRRGVHTPPYLPLIGHLHNVLNIPKMQHLFLYEEFMKHPSKEIMGLYLNFTPSIIVQSPDLVQSVLIKDFDHFVDRRQFKFDDEVFDQMLTVIKGSHWKGVRSLMTPTFTSGKMKNMYYLVQERATELTKFFWREKDKDSVVDLKTSFGKYTMDVIGSCAFGMEVDSLNGKNQEFFDSADGLFNRSGWRFLRVFLLFVMPSVARFFKISFLSPTRTILYKAVQNTIDNRKEGPRRGDFMDLLLDARKTIQEDESKGKVHKYPISDATIMAQSVLFIVAGYDTTANTLVFTTHLLAKHQKCQDLLRQEIRELVRQSEEHDLTYQDIMAAPYMDAVISEVLRLYPPALLTDRCCTKEYKVPGTSVVVPEGMHLTVPIWSLQNDPRYFENPEEFKPERFLPENKQNIVPGTYLPFGLGPRMCLAQRFALMEAKLALAYLMLEFRFRPAKGFEEIRIDSRPGVLRPHKDGLKVVVEKLEEKAMDQ